MSDFVRTVPYYYRLLCSILILSNPASKTSVIMSSIHIKTTPHNVIMYQSWEPALKKILFIVYEKGCSQNISVWIFILITKSNMAKIHNKGTNVFYSVAICTCTYTFSVAGVRCTCHLCIKLKCPLDKITPNYIFVRRFPTIVVSFLYPRYPMGLRSRGRGTTSLSSTRIPILTVRSAYRFIGKCWLKP